VAKPEGRVPTSLARVWRSGSGVLLVTSGIGAAARRRCLPLLPSAAVLAAVAVLLAAGATFAGEPAPGSPAARLPDVRKRLERDGFLRVGPDGAPTRHGVALTMGYEMGKRRRIGKSIEEVNLYVTRGAVAVPYPPAEVLGLLLAFDGYNAWATKGLNDARLHPKYPKVRSWNFDILRIGPARGYPGIVFDVRVFKFGRGSVSLRQLERTDGGAARPSLLYLTLGARNLFVKHFTLTFFVIPLPGGKGTAIQFENECGLRSVVDWFFRDAKDNPVASTKPRIGRFLENIDRELARRRAERARPRRRASF